MCLAAKIGVIFLVTKEIKIKQKKEITPEQQRKEEQKKFAGRKNKIG
jgi:hypothetical protein